MIIILVIILAGVVIFLVGTQRGLRYEEECAAQIQEQVYRYTGDHIDLGEARCRLRLLVDLISKTANEIPEFISLRQARELALVLNNDALRGGWELGGKKTVELIRDTLKLAKAVRGITGK